MIRGILFDMDGLMFDTEAIGYRGWKGAGRRLGIRIDDEAIAALRGLGDREKREMFGRMTGRPEEYEKALAVRVDYADQWISENGLPVKQGLKELLCYQRYIYIVYIYLILRYQEKQKIQRAVKALCMEFMLSLL